MTTGRLEDARKHGHSEANRSAPAAGLHDHERTRFTLKAEAEASWGPGDLSLDRPARVLVTHSLCSLWRTAGVAGSAGERPKLHRRFDAHLYLEEFQLPL